MNRFRPSLAVPVAAVFVLGASLAGCNKRQDPSSSAAETAQQRDLSNRSGARAANGGAESQAPVARDAAAASAAVSSQTTGTSPMPGEVTRPPTGSPNTRGGTGHPK